MQADFLAAINWEAPWLAPYRALGSQLAEATDWRSTLNALAAQRDLRNFRGQPLRFIPQESLPQGTPYEAHIGATGLVPTRDNLHDFFNALVWLHFPLTKAKLNALQFAQLEQDRKGQAGSYRVGPRRGAVRDAATIFDENCALVLYQDRSLVDGLIAHEWTEVFLQRREAFLQQCRIILFGHALMEKLVHPYPAITAHCLPLALNTADDTMQALDCRVPSSLSESLSTRCFFPLPVFGIPGWHPGQDSAFYSNQTVFRPARKQI